jgi:L-ascorbate metabolism protein UlaG (beta-lactamase superfamily)
MTNDWSKPLIRIQGQKQRFLNPTGTEPKGAIDLMKWVFLEKKAQWPRWIENSCKATLKENLQGKDLNCVMVNHATLLLQLPEGNLLTDPVFSKRTSPFQWAGPARHRAPGLGLNQLPPIHTVLLSHNHYDHMDLNSLRSLWKKHDPVFLMPLMNSHFLKEAGIQSDKIHELNWWQDFKFDSGFRVVLTPAQHWSSRGPRDRNQALWGGFWIENSHRKIFFAGDTGYADHFHQIQKKLGSPALSLMPIGAYEPRWFMRDQHMNPEDAVQAHLDLQSELSLGIHWGTWQLTNEGFEDPLQALQLAKSKFSLLDSSFRPLSNGESLCL